MIFLIQEVLKKFEEIHSYQKNELIIWISSILLRIVYQTNEILSKNLILKLKEIQKKFVEINDGYCLKLISDSIIISENSLEYEEMNEILNGNFEVEIKESTILLKLRLLDLKKMNETIKYQNLCRFLTKKYLEFDDHEFLFKQSKFISKFSFHESFIILIKALILSPPSNRIDEDYKRFSQIICSHLEFHSIDPMSLCYLASVKLSEEIMKRILTDLDYSIELLLNLTYESIESISKELIELIFEFRKSKDSSIDSNLESLDKKYLNEPLKRPNLLFLKYLSKNKFPNHLMNIKEMKEISILYLPFYLKKKRNFFEKEKLFCDVLDQFLDDEYIKIVFFHLTELMNPSLSIYYINKIYQKEQYHNLIILHIQQLLEKKRKFQNCSEFCKF